MDQSNPNEKTLQHNDHCDTENSVTNENTACHISSGRKSHHSEKTKQNLITRLNRVEGQIRGIKGLIEKDTYCDDVITQISATQAALNSVAKILLEGHLRSCVVERIQEGDDEIIDELLTTIQRLMKK
ncbi:metal-sensitive transcriptional regulator [Neobacillus sp. LXY-4]|uniref:metal-sensitive transcriptional regulator n=1 Tax=Neobacillus sp. LXY-4 TaxID=3379826 RepID=UPI003EDF412D